MEFDPNAWGWPQWTYMALALLSLIISAGSHGKEREPHNGFMAFIAFGLAVFLLSAGGFFA